MADIAIKCPACGRENKISEYASADMFVCSACKKPLEQPSHAAGARLKVRTIEDNRRSTLVGERIPPPLEEAKRIAEAGAQVEAVVKDVHKARTKVKTYKTLWNYLAFLLVGGILVGGQYLVQRNPALMQSYAMTRLVVMGLTTLAVLLAAFQDSTFQGLLCFLPPYTLYYAFVRLESFALRGAFAAVCVAFFTEVYFIGDRAVLPNVQKGAENFVTNVGLWIDAASAKPEALGSGPRR